MSEFLWSLAVFRGTQHPNERREDGRDSMLHEELFD